MTDIRVVTAHSKEIYYVIQGDDWYYPEYNKKLKKYELIPTIVDENRKLKAKKTDMNEVIYKLQKRIEEI